MDKNLSGNKRPVERLFVRKRELELDQEPDNWSAIQMQNFDIMRYYRNNAKQLQ